MWISSCDIQFALGMIPLGIIGGWVVCLYFKLICTNTENCKTNPPVWKSSEPSSQTWKVSAVIPVVHSKMPFFYLVNGRVQHDGDHSCYCSKYCTYMRHRHPHWRSPTGREEHKHTTIFMPHLGHHWAYALRPSLEVFAAVRTVRWAQTNTVQYNSPDFKSTFMHESLFKLI